MAKYRGALPQLSGSTLLLTDSGMETDLIFHEGFELPLFASFVLLENKAGTEALRNYYRRHVNVAQVSKAGFVFEAVTWRASIDWARQLGYDEASVAEVNRQAVNLVVELREELGEEAGPMVISGPIGPRGDAYNPAELMTAEEAQEYHSAQVETLSATEADLVSAFTLTHAAEAIGIARAAQAAEIPAVISFTVETDGALPDGSSLASAIIEVDEATSSSPAYYGINCAHPSHFVGALQAQKDWTERIGIIRPNASRMSHAELDNATELDDGNPEEFGRECAQIRENFPHINVLGGCCGTDVRHVQAVAKACL